MTHAEILLQHGDELTVLGEPAPPDDRRQLRDRLAGALFDVRQLRGERLVHVCT